MNMQIIEALRPLNRREKTRLMERGALNYAAANRSDPFAFNRAMTHIQIGVCSVDYDKNGVRQDDFYNAEMYHETRKLPDGRTFTLPAYKNVRRP